MIKRGNVQIGVILTATIVGVFLFFLYDFKGLITTNNTFAKQNTGDIKDNIIMDIFAPEISKAIKQHYKMDSFGYGISNFEISNGNESDHVSYYVLFNVEVMNQNVGENKMKILGNDTLKFVLGFDKEIQIKLISYSHNE